MDKKHVIQNAHKQVISLLSMWNCCGITAVEASQILISNANDILNTDIEATSFEPTKPSPPDAFKQWQKGCDALFGKEPIAENTPKQPPAYAEPIPDKTWWSEEYGKFHRNVKPGQWVTYTKGSMFANTWYPRRGEFPKWDGRDKR